VETDDESGNLLTWIRSMLQDYINVISADVMAACHRVICKYNIEAKDNVSSIVYIFVGEYVISIINCIIQ